jgi:predicted 2-oxoglutarate/Fe(II)-dependent dioxygenase YbiX
MATDDLLRAVGTLHCPHCHMPLFANPLGRGHGDVAAARGRFVAPFVYLADDAFGAAADLVADIEKLTLWSPAGVIGADGARYGESRRNEFLPLTAQADASLGPWEAGVRDCLHAAANAYAAAVEHLTLRSDLGYQVLRYGVGEEFREHVDEFPGPSVYGQRQLTALLYLNDDFEGGELTLPQQGLEYNPRAGSLLLFPSGFCFPHSSRPVRRGTKYSCVTWFV